MQSLLSNTCDLFSGILAVFYEMERKINVINNKIFCKIIFKNKSKRKRNFIIHYFLVKTKPYESVDLLITASVNIYQTKIPKVMKTCFS